MKTTFAILLLNLFFLSVFSQVERRFQVWNQNDISFQPWENISVEVAEKIHYAPKLGSIELRYAEFFLSHQPNNWFKYGGGFRISQANLYPGWLDEDRTMLFVELSKNNNHFLFEFSNRFEYRDFNVGASHIRHKQSLSINFPSISPLLLRFYITEETFYKLDGVGIHLARLYTGISALKKKHFNLKLYYAFEKYKLTSWNSTDIAGVNLNFKL